MTPIMGRWAQCMKNRDEAAAGKEIDAITPMLIETAWYANYKGEWVLTVTLRCAMPSAAVR